MSFIILRPSTSWINVQIISLFNHEHGLQLRPRASINVAVMIHLCSILSSIEEQVLPWKFQYHPHLILGDIWPLILMMIQPISEWEL